MRDLQSELDEATKAYREERFDDALELLERIPPAHPFDLSAYYLAATIYENGGAKQGINFEKALEYYTLLDRESDWFGSTGAVGYARTLSKMDCCANQDLIESYCRKAIDLEDSLPAHFILAQMYEECRGKHREARKHYLHMFRHLRPFGLRYYARSHMAHGSKLIGVLAHVATTLVSPILFIVNRGAVDPEVR